MAMGSLWAFKGHIFKLRKFQNSLYTLNDTTTFLEQHPEITIYHDTQHSVCYLKHGILPSLEEATVCHCVLGGLKSYRSLTALHLDTSLLPYYDEKKILGPLEELASSL